MTDLVVAKFGGTSVADFDAMNRSVDVALLDANTRVVVLSASAGVTNLLVAIIGNELSKACGVGKEVFGVLDPFNIRMICYGASSHNLCFLVPGADAEKVVQKLHHNLFE